MSAYPFETFADALEEEANGLLEMYALPGTYVQCHQSVRALWEWQPDTLVGVLASWWENTRVTDTTSLIFNPAPLPGDPSPEAIAAGFSLCMVRGAWEEGRRCLRVFILGATYRSMCELTDATAELVLDVRAREPQ